MFDVPGELPLVSLLNRVGGDSMFDVPGELPLVSLLVLVHEVPHVVGDVDAHDVLAVDVGIQGGALGVVSGESLLGVGDVKAAISSSLHGAKDFGSSGGPGESNVETGTEGSWTVVDILDTEMGAVDVLVALVGAVQVELLEHTASQEQTGAVGGSVVSQTNLDAERGKFVRVSCTDNDVAFKPGVGDLAADVLVGEPDDHPVLGGVVLVFVLDDQALPGEVVGVSLAAPAELDLEPLEVSLVLDQLDERHAETSLVEVNQAIL